MDAISRHAEVIGGHLQVSAVFEDDLFIVRGSGTSAA